MSISPGFLFQINCDRINQKDLSENYFDAFDYVPLGNIMKFYKNLYIGDTIKKPDKIKRKLKKYAKLNNVYLIAYVAENRRLEIYHSLMMQQYYYKENPPYIIGIAGNRDEAAQIICRIAEEAIHETGKADLVEYLFSDERF